MSLVIQLKDIEKSSIRLFCPHHHCYVTFAYPLHVYWNAVYSNAQISNLPLKVYKPILVFETPTQYT